MSNLPKSFVILFLCTSTLLAQGQANHGSNLKISTPSYRILPSSQLSASNPERLSNSLKKTGSMPFPVMVYPANGATNVPLIPKFLIQTVAGGLRYDLEVASDQYFNNIIERPYIVFSSPTDSGFQFRFDAAVVSPNSFTNNTTYFWRVQVTDSSGQNTSGWSQPYSYTTTSPGVPVSQPALLLPVNYSTIQWVGMNFRWYPSSGATQYQIQWSMDYFFNGFIYTWSDANQTSLTEDLKPNTTYYWRVIAYNDGSISQFSPIGKFYTGTVDTLTAASGSFDDGSGTDNYANNLDVSWLIIPPKAKQIVLSFSSFHTEANYDFVTIYDGSTTGDPVIGRFSGDNLPPQVRSSGGAMLVRFTTDFYTNEQGWTANYYSISRSDAITGKLLNLAFDPWTGDSSLVPLPNTSVSIYSGNSLVNTTTSENNGEFMIGGLDSNKTYKLVVNANGTDPITQQPIALTYQDTAHTIRDNLTFIVPLSLYETTYGLIDSLEHPQVDLSSVTDLGVGSASIDGYDENGAVSLLNSKANLTTPMSSDEASSLVRLTLAEGMTNKFLGDAGTLSIETLQTLIPFIQKLVGLCSIGNLVQESVDALIGDIGNTLLNSALQQAQSLVNSELSKIPSPDGQLLQVAANALFLDAYSATEEPSDFAKERAINNFAIPLGASLFLEKYYIPLATQSLLNSAISNSTLGLMSGSAGGAFSVSNGIYETSHAKTLKAMSDANNYLQTSGWADLTGKAAGLLSGIVSISVVGAPLAVALSVFSGVASVGAAGTAGLALYKDFSRLASLPHDLSSAMSSIYNPMMSSNYKMFSVQRSYGKVKDIDAIKAGLRMASDDYNIELSNCLAQIRAGNRTAARSIMPSILALDSALNSQTRLSSYTMNAAFIVADSSIPGFDNLYSSTNDSILNSMATRQATYLNMLAYLMDSTSTSYADSIDQYGQMAIEANNQMISSVNQTLNTIQSVGVPGFIAPIFTKAPVPIGLGSNFIVSVSFKNFGGTAADNVYAKIFLTSGFTAANDSIFIGELSAGATDSISFVVTAPDVDTTGSYSVLFLSSDASSSPASGPLRSSNATGVKQTPSSVPKSYGLLQNYPNPFNPSTVIEYAIPSKAHVELIIWDLLGRRVKTLVDQEEAPGTYKVIFNASDIPSGVYFYRIVAGSFVQTKKMMVIR